MPRTSAAGHDDPQILILTTMCFSRFPTPGRLCPVADSLFAELARSAVVRRIVLLGGVLLAGMLTGGGRCAIGVEPAIQLAIDGVSVEGTPLAWSSGQVLFLLRNGFLWQFAPDEVQDYRQLPNSFRPYSQSEMRGQLLREFGRRFEVSGTGNYLVVHPAGQRDRWAQRFEELYRTFVQYFSTRGMRPAAPPFPLVAVVFHSQAEFVRYVQQSGGSVSPNIVGFYSPRSNRVILYDVTQGQASDADWHFNADTIIHEATHQMAFNTHVHSRAAIPPRWAGEGLAMLFERRVCGTLGTIPIWRTVSIALDWTISRNMHVRAARRKPSLGYPLVRAAVCRGTVDRLCRSLGPDLLLSEKEPVKYMKYLARTAAREPLKSYGPDEQLKEFTDIFGTDLKMLEARYLRFIQQL